MAEGAAADSTTVGNGYRPWRRSLALVVALFGALLIAVALFRSLVHDAGVAATTIGLTIGVVAVAWSMVVGSPMSLPLGTFGSGASLIAAWALTGQHGWLAAPGILLVGYGLVVGVPQARNLWRERIERVRVLRLQHSGVQVIGRISRVVDTTQTQGHESTVELTVEYPMPDEDTGTATVTEVFPTLDTPKVGDAAVVWYDRDDPTEAVTSAKLTDIPLARLERASRGGAHDHGVPGRVTSGQPVAGQQAGGLAGQSSGQQAQPQLGQSPQGQSLQGQSLQGRQHLSATPPTAAQQTAYQPTTSQQATTSTEQSTQDTDPQRSSELAALTLLRDRGVLSEIEFNSIKGRISPTANRDADED